MTHTKSFDPDHSDEIQRLETALSAAAVGTWEYDKNLDEFRLCERFKGLFGYDLQNIVPLETLLTRVEAADRHLLKNRFDENAADGGLLDLEFRIVQNNTQDAVWLHLKGQVRMNTNGNCIWSGIASDVTRFVNAARIAREESQQLAQQTTKQRREIDRFRALIEHAPVAICLFTGPDMVVELANEPMVTYWGKDMTVIGKPLREAMPELDGQPFHQLLADILVSKKAYVARDARVDIEVNGVLGTYYFDFTYKPLLDENGEVYTIINISIDVTQRVLAERALRESKNRLRSIIAGAPAAIGVFMGRDLVVEMPNQTFIDIVGKGPDITGKPLREIMPELENQAYLQILDDVFTTGEMYRSYGTQVDIVRHGKMTHDYFNITYSPLFDENGEVYAILDIAIDVTEKMEEQKRMEESQTQLLSLFEQSPVAIAIIGRENLTFTMANAFYADLVGRKQADIIGKPLLEAIPEIAGQGFDKLLEEVIDTGKHYTSLEQPVVLLKNEALDTYFVDLTYQPKMEMNGDISGVLVVATDVTSQVLARRKIEEAENTLRNAIDLAELGTWQLQPVTGELDFSPRLAHWFGVEEDEPVTLEKILACISADDLPDTKHAIAQAMSAKTDAVFDIEFTLTPSQSRIERILHTQALVMVDDNKEIKKIVGSVQDVTMLRKTMLALEQQVQIRTEELKSSNEELAAINEEYMTLNEDLSLSNELLVQSNENLQQFAYVASHDLQEPLRKIQSFGDLLKNRYKNSLGDGTEYIDRMQSAAKRMSTLIADLLAFSRVSSHITKTELVSLDEVVAATLGDLEFPIQQADAQISVGTLPIIPGDRRQLGQMFQNLISNAIKFREPDVPPVISIGAKIIPSNEVPDAVRPSRFSDSYHLIEVSDNGIGFDEKYTDRIFQIFQRLQGRSEYEGTGIGLAICQKVVLNHGGAITARSAVNAGSTFQIFLPVD